MTAGTTRFATVKLLGRGGFGEVYLAEDRELGRPVALKVLSGQASRSDEVFRRFVREAQVQARLEHPNVVRIYDCRFDAEPPWIAMELVDGEDLDQLVQRDGPLDAPRLELLGRELAGALDHLHEAGVLHRDLKPANVMLRRGSGQAVVMDLGLASVRDATALTRTGQIVGSPAYLPPETMRGEPWTRASDFYQVGAILFEAATARRYVPGRTLDEVVASLTVGRVADFPEHLGVPALLQAVTYKAAAFAPADRFPSGASLVATLDSGIPPRVPQLERSAATPSPMESGGFSFLDALDTSRGGTWAAVPRGLPLQALVGGLLIGCILLGMLWPGPHPPEEVRWSTAGDTLVVSFRGGGEGVVLRVGEVEVAPGDADETGRRRAVHRGLLHGVEIPAQLTWDGGEGPVTPVTGERPAIQDEVLLAPGGAVAVQVLRPVTAWWRGWERAATRLDRGIQRLPLPDEPRPGMELTWKEGEAISSRPLEMEAVARATARALRERLEGVDPHPVYLERALAADKAGDGYPRQRRTWEPLLPWIPELLVDEELALPERRALWELWQTWQWTVPAERFCGDSVEGLGLPAGVAGGRGVGGPLWEAATTREVSLEPLNGAEPWQRRGRKGQHLLMVLASVRERWATGKFVEGASEARFTWPEDAPRAGLVCVTFRVKRLPVHMQLRVGPSAGRGVTARVWHPEVRIPEPESFEGDLSVYLPAALAPAPGSDAELALLPLISENANFASVWGVSVSWPRSKGDR